jgi:hypothetical protein
MNVSELHQEIVNRLADLADAMDSVLIAADAAAAAAEGVPGMRDYRKALLPLMSLTVPHLPPPPNA